MGRWPVYVNGPFANRGEAYEYGGWANFKEDDFKPLRIRITAIRRETVQDISEADARAEGVASVAEYAALWDSINGKTKGADWRSNPDVWVLEFEVVK